MDFKENFNLIQPEFLIQNIIIIFNKFYNINYKIKHNGEDYLLEILDILYLYKNKINK